MDDRRMVLKDPVLAAKKRRGKEPRRGTSQSDELFFNDDFKDNGLAYGEDYRSSESEGGGYGGALVPARRRSKDDDALLDRALERIQRAKAKGKASVSLTHEELAALERRNSGPSDAERPRSSRHKPRREDSGSSSNNTSPNNGTRSRHKKQPSRTNSGFFGGGNSPRPTSKRSSKGMRSDTEAKSSARTRDLTPPRASRAGPVAYYNGRSDRRTASGDDSRRQPAPSLRERYSDEQPQPAYRAYNPNMSAPRDRDVDRGYRSDAGYRTASDPYRNPRPPYPVPDSLARYEVPADDDDRRDRLQGGGGGVPPAARHPAAATAAYSNSSRRIVSGPADANYSNLVRRVPVGSRTSDVSARGFPASGSDPVLLDTARMRMPGRMDDDSGEGSEDNDEDGEEDYDVGGRRRVRRQGSSTPPTAYNSNGVGRTRSGSTGWARRKR